MDSAGYVEREVSAGGLTLSLLVPSDPEALLDEDAFAADEFLPYWAELWPSGLALAEAVAGVDGPVLELGCGLGIPSLVAALGGADVLATDWAPDAIALLERNAERVGARLQAQVWDWRTPPPAPRPLVIGADLLYEARNGPPLLAALDALVAPGGEAWIADPDRPAAPAFFAAAVQAWTVEALAPRVTRLRRR
jgi:predicted nicotinamide N-methyase